MSAETIREWLRQREIRGKTIASLEEVCGAFPHLSRQVIFNNLSRLKKVKDTLFSIQCFLCDHPLAVCIAG